jgi:hypothetical protein
MKKIYTILAISSFVFFLISLNAQIPNSGFEEWVVDGNNNNPVDWSTTNHDPIVSVTPYTPAYAGDYSMRVSTYDAEILIITGVASVDFPHAQRPSELNACIKTAVMPGDKVYLIVAFYQGDSIVALPTDCTFSIDTTISEFTCLTFPITYQSILNPDSASIIIIAGSESAQLGTEIIVDELSFNVATTIDHRTAISKPVAENFPNPAENFTYIPVNLVQPSDLELLIWDLKGTMVHSQSIQKLPVGEHELLVNTSQLTSGIYLYSVRGEDIFLHSKMVICK